MKVNHARAHLALCIMRIITYIIHIFKRESERERRELLYSHLLTSLPPFTNCHNVYDAVYLAELTQDLDDVFTLGTKLGEG